MIGRPLWEVVLLCLMLLLPDFVERSVALAGFGMLCGEPLSFPEIYRYHNPDPTCLCLTL